MPLKKMIRDSSFTILGDLAQGIHSYRGSRDWGDSRDVFGGDGLEMLTLERSYRTTVEIMTAANQVIAHLDEPNLVMAKPAIRHGEARADHPAGGRHGHGPLDGG